MKKMLMLALLAVAIVAAPTVQAEYSTTALTKASPYTLDCQVAGTNVAVTVLLIRAGGRIDVDDSGPMVNPSGPRSIPRGVERIIFLVDAPSGATGLFRVTQNSQPLAELPIGGSAPVSLNVTFDVQ